MKPLILIILTFFLLNGCTITNNSNSLNKNQRDIIKKLMDKEFACSYDIKEVDLNKDGKKKFIVIYSFPPHNGGVKVIKFDNNKASILFENTCSTSADFKIINNIPTIIFKESDYTLDS